MHVSRVCTQANIFSSVRLALFQMYIFEYRTYARYIATCFFQLMHQRSTARERLGDADLHTSYRPLHSTRQ